MRVRLCGKDTEKPRKRQCKPLPASPKRDTDSALEEIMAKTRKPIRKSQSDIQQQVAAEVQRLATAFANALTEAFQVLFEKVESGEISPEDAKVLLARYAKRTGKNFVANASDESEPADETRMPSNEGISRPTMSPRRARKSKKR